MSEELKACDVKAMAQAAYSQMCGYAGADHEGHCVHLLEQSFQSFEDKVQEAWNTRADEKRIRAECMEKAVEAVKESKSTLHSQTAMAAFGHDLAIKAIKDSLGGEECTQ